MDSSLLGGGLSGGISGGAGGISPSSSSAATNTGGTNTVGGTVFGSYNPAPSTTQSLVPWLIGAAVMGMAFFMLKGGK